jgi:DNA (cytosine-5)-methyltransferase 1
MKILSLFSGIGAFEKALKNNGVNVELVNYCEIDKYASKAYSLIHNVSEGLNLKDVTKVDTTKLPDDLDLITYGFPCQDISIAGKQKGFKDEEGNNTRSGLFFEALRIIKDTQPKIAIAENVKALTSKKFQAEFNTVLSSLNDVGYNNYYQVLNAKDYGIPQNRERVFIVSIRKDIDDGSFRFSEKMELKLKLKDLLENEVDEKYYLSKEVQERFTMTDPTFEKNIIGTTKPACRTIGQRDLVYQENSIMGALVATDYKQPKQILQVAQIYPNNGKFTFPQPFKLEIRLKDMLEDDVDEKYYLKDSKQFFINNSLEQESKGNGFRFEPHVKENAYLAKTITTRAGGRMDDNFILDNLQTNESKFTFNTDNMTKIILCNLLDMNGDYKGSFDNTQCGRVYSQKGLSPTLNTMQGGGLEPKIIDAIYNHREPRVYSETAPTLRSERFGLLVSEVFKIRKLTPRECWRLMGFDDTDIQKCINAGISDSQLYKMAGNSIVVNVLSAIFKTLED